MQNNQISKEDAIAELKRRAQEELMNRHPGVKASRFFLENAGLMLGEAAGGAAGALAGGIAGAPTGPGALGTAAAGAAGGSMIGGGLGEAAGEMASTGLESMMGLRKPPRMGEIAQNAAEGFNRGAGYSIGGKLMAGAGKLAAETPIGKSVVKATNENLGKIYELVTGKGKETLERIKANPHWLLPEKMGGAKSMSKAAEDYGLARKEVVSSVKDDVESLLKKAGIETKGMSKAALDQIKSDADLLSTLKSTTKDLDIELESRPGFKKKLDIISKKAIKGEELTPQEAVIGHEYANARERGLRNKIGFLGSTAQKEDRVELGNVRRIKQYTRNYLDQNFPKFGHAINEYMKAVTKKDATDLLPSSFAGRYVSRRLLLLMAGFSSPKMLAGVLGTTSPAAWTGATTALRSGVLKAPAMKAIDMLRKRRDGDDEE